MPEYPLCKNRFYRLCRAVFFWCTALSFSLLAVCSIVVTAYFPEDYTEIPFLSFSAMPWVALGCGAVCAAGVWLAKCLHHVPPFALKLAPCLCVFAVSASPASGRAFLWRSAASAYSRPSPTRNTALLGLARMASAIRQHAAR